MSTVRRRATTQRDGNRASSNEEGMATVEIAIGMVAVVVILTIVVAVVSAGIARAQACQTARDVARAASTGLTLADPSVSISVKGRWITATATAHLGLEWLPGGVAQCSVTTLMESHLP